MSNQKNMIEHGCVIVVSTCEYDANEYLFESSPRR